MASWMNHKSWAAAPAVMGGRVVVRTVAGIYAGGATLALVALVVSPPGNGGTVWPAVALCVCAYALAALSLHDRAGRLPRGGYEALVALATVLITLALVLGGSDAREPSALLYLWAAPLAF